jgi:hypothetical protein
MTAGELGIGSLELVGFRQISCALPAEEGPHTWLLENVILTKISDPTPIIWNATP